MHQKFYFIGAYMIAIFLLTACSYDPSQHQRYANETEEPVTDKEEKVIVEIDTQSILAETAEAPETINDIITYPRGVFSGIKQRVLMCPRQLAVPR